jgi:transcription elongation factor Elf1
MHEATKGRGPGQWWPCTNGTPITLYCPNCGKPHGITHPPDVGQFECTVCGHRGDIKLIEVAEPVDNRFSWFDFQDIGNTPAVDEAMRNQLEDPTDDNATCLIRAVIEAAGRRLEDLAAQPTAQGVELTDDDIIMLLHEQTTRSTSDKLDYLIDPAEAVAFARNAIRAAQPPAAEPLTDEQIDELVTQHAGYGRDDIRAVVHAVERAHGIKETT